MGVYYCSLWNEVVYFAFVVMFNYS